MNTHNKIERKEFLFLIAWGIFICTIIVGVTFLKYQEGYEFVETPVKLVRLVSYLICMIVILYRAYKRNKLIMIAIAAGIVLLTCITTSNSVMIWCLLFTVGAKELDAEKILKVSTLGQGVMLVGTIALSQMGIIRDHIFSAETRARHGLGFDWATTGTIIFFFFMLQYIYIRRKNLKWYECVILEIINYLFYVYTDTRMAFYVGTATILFFMCASFFKNKWRISNRLGYLFCFAPAIIAIFAILLHVLYNENSSLFVKLNSLLSGRLELGLDAFRTYGVSLLGQKIQWVGFDYTESTIGYNYVDCSYLQILLEFGLIFLIMVMAIYTYMIYKAIKKKDYYLVWICIIILIFSITEPRLYNFTFNPIPVIVLARLKDRSKENDGVNDEKKCENYCCNP